MPSPFLPGHVSEQLERASTEGDLSGLAARYLDDLGFSGFSWIFGWEASLSEGAKVISTLTNYPPEWDQALPRAELCRSRSGP